MRCRPSAWRSPLRARTPASAAGSASTSLPPSRSGGLFVLAVSRSPVLLLPLLAPSSVSPSGAVCALARDASRAWSIAGIAGFLLSHSEHGLADFACDWSCVVCAGHSARVRLGRFAVQALKQAQTGQGNRGQAPGDGEMRCWSRESWSNSESATMCPLVHSSPVQPKPVFLAKSRRQQRPRTRLATCQQKYFQYNQRPRPRKTNTVSGRQRQYLRAERANDERQHRSQRRRLHLHKDEDTPKLNREQLRKESQETEAGRSSDKRRSTKRQGGGRKGTKRRAATNHHARSTNETNGERSPIPARWQRPPCVRRTAAGRSPAAPADAAWQAHTTRIAS